jgi:hypothetical protein
MEKNEMGYHHDQKNVCLRRFNEIRKIQKKSKLQK